MVLHAVLAVLPARAVLSVVVVLAVLQWLPIVLMLLIADFVVVCVSVRVVDARSRRQIDGMLS